MSLRRRLFYALITLISVLAISVTGYQVLGGSSVTFLQSLYMAVITLAGVGYGEIIDTSHNPHLRIFNMFVVLVGVTLTVYVFSVVTAFLVEGEIRNIFWRRRMERRISELKNHFIICGIGDTGRYSVEELQKTHTPFVVVDSNEEHIKRFQESHAELSKDLLYVIGDAADAAVLQQAGLEAAKGLIAAVPSDKDNLVITVMSRQLNPKMRIIARCTDSKFAERLIKAGATGTVSPNQIGGLRMASEVLRPHVVSFLDLMLKEKSRTLRIEEIEIPEGSGWVGLSLKGADLRGKYKLLPLAAKAPGDDDDMKFIVDPPDDFVLQKGSVIIVMGDVNELHRARHDAHHKHNPLAAIRN